jgi:hypothetical protein
MQIEYSGPESGTGAKWSWQSKKEGSGTMTLIATDPARKVAFDLYFPDVGTTSQGQLDFVPDNNSTKVTWTMNGDMGSNPMYRWMALFMDRMVGPDFDTGLANLKAVAEKQ